MPGDSVMAKTNQDGMEPDQIITELYKSLNIDFTFQPRLNLIEGLLTLADLGKISDILEQKNWGNLYSSLQDEKNRLDKRDCRLIAPDPKTNNSINTWNEPNLLTAAVFTQFAPNAQNQFQGLQLLLLYLVTKKSTKAVEFANEMLLSAKTDSPRFKILQQLPKLVEVKSSYIAQLEVALALQRHQSLSNIQRNFVLTLERLVVAANNEVYSSSPPQPPHLGGLLKNEGQLVVPLPGEVPPDTGRVFKLPGNDGETDEPDVDLGWVYVPKKPTEDTEENHEEDTEAEARRTRYWLRNAANRSINDEAIFSPLEKIILNQYLNKNLTYIDSPEKTAAALLIGLMYATGRSIEEIIAAKIGAEKTFSPDGAYRKALPATKKPTDSKENKIVSLELPDVLKTWFMRQDPSSICNISIGNILHLSVDDAKEIIKSELDVLRENGRFRIKFSRIPAGLPAELSARTRNSAITYLLAYSDEQEVPTLLYYQRLTEPILIAAYQEVIKHMFPKC